MRCNAKPKVFTINHKNLGCAGLKIISNIGSKSDVTIPCYHIKTEVVLSNVNGNSIYKVIFNSIVVDILFCKEHLQFTRCFMVY
ncbi:hypothetical protein D1839_15435 [Roseburia sp. 1XD42-34]|nr:hypothetical protein [Roseburia sp. 1XD42-34]RKI75717.1 hypothetical protein D7V87_15520 [Clostridium sp. 1xD42-85]